MAQDLSKYENSQVGRLQGADYFFFKSATGGGFTFFDEVDVSAQEIMLMLRSMTTVQSTISQAGSVLSVSLFTELSGTGTMDYGIFPFVALDGASKCSMKIPVARRGAIMKFDFMSFSGDANISLFTGAAAAGGVTSASCETAAGVNVSCFCISAEGMLTLVGKQAGLWSILDASASVTVQAAA